MGHRTGQHHHADDRHYLNMGWRFWQGVDPLTVGFGPLPQPLGQGQRTHGCHPHASKGDGVASPVE
eukprot:6555687-Karenia_brevis.AAC.1